MKKIKVSIPNKSYNVYLGNNIFAQLKNILKREHCFNNTLLVIDKNVMKYYEGEINSFVSQFDFKIKLVTLRATEKSKSIESISRIHNALIKHSFGRDTVIIAIGGGIVGDITGFAASTYMRGVKYVQVPTTLLSAVDSSVGGKTGINFGETKNIIGSFYQPEFVLIDTRFFNTLSNEEMLCGLGEIIKYAFLSDQNFFTYVKNNYEKVLENYPNVIYKVITESVNFKAGVVEADEKENGIRKILNLGHTFAHALEVQQEHKLKHGQAVIIGIACAVFLSHKLNLLNASDKDKFINLISNFTDRIKLTSVNKNIIYKIMLRDKKNRDNEIRFVLIKGIGEIITDYSAPKKETLNSLDEAIKMFSK